MFKQLNKAFSQDNRYKLSMLSRDKIWIKYHQGTIFTELLVHNEENKYWLSIKTFSMGIFDCSDILDSIDEVINLIPHYIQKHIDAYLNFYMSA